MARRKRKPRSKATVKAAKKRAARLQLGPQTVGAPSASASASSLVASQQSQEHEPSPSPLSFSQPNRHLALAGNAQATLFERYYRAVNILPAHEWPAMIATLSRPLPVSFRVVGGPRTTEARAALGAIQQTLQREGATPLPWCDGWQIQADSGALKMSSRPGLRELHAWLVEASHGGLVVRQEAVSMVPAALLHIKPGHKVLDMCASPGSKTTQALEAVHGDGGAEDTAAGGLVVANDTDARRARLLIRRCAALGELTDRLAVTQHDATKFPNVLAPCWRGGEDDTRGLREQRYLDGPYDRVLCDVPCSGDGTLRKNPEVWSRWNPEFGAGLHMLQLRLALRAIALLRVGGCLAYSTCSLNPAEDEAVVAELLRRCHGAVQVVDVRSGETLDGDTTNDVHAAASKSRPGICDWPVYASMPGEEEGAPATLVVPEKSSRGFPPSLWPPTKDEMELRGELTKCLRFFPHDNDTGGFFVCILRKTSTLPGPPSKGSSSGSKSGTSRSRPHDRKAGHTSAELPQRIPCLRRVTGDALDEAWKCVGGNPEATDEKARFQRCTFTRSPNATCAGKSAWWLTDAMAEHVADHPGSAKLHILLAGSPLLTRTRIRGGLGGTPGGRVVARSLGYGGRKANEGGVLASPSGSCSWRIRHEGAALLPSIRHSAKGCMLPVRAEVMCKLLAPVADTASSKTSLARIVLSTKELRDRLLSWREMSAFEECDEGAIVLSSAKGQRSISLAAEKVVVKKDVGVGAVAADDEEPVAYLVVTWPRTKGLERAPAAAARRIIRLLGGSSGLSSERRGGGARSNQKAYR